MMYHISVDHVGHRCLLPDCFEFRIVGNPGENMGEENIEHDADQQ